MYVVQDAHRYSAVVFESYVPYSPSGRNALCVVQDAHRYCAVVVVTQLTFVPKQKYATDGAAAPRRFREDSRSVRHAEIEAHNLSRMS